MYKRQLYLDLGNISEDILRDGRKAFENGLPKDAQDAAAPFDPTAWGVVPTTQNVVNAFALLESNSNQYQDVGMDGLPSKPEVTNPLQGTEQQFFSSYVNSVASAVSDPDALSRIQADPSNDDYQFFRGTSLDNQQASILDRYKRFNNPEGNSVTDEDSPEDYPTQQTVIPTTEDINLDQNLAEGESYFHYALSLIHI